MVCFCEGVSANRCIWHMLTKTGQMRALAYSSIENVTGLEHVLLKALFNFSLRIRFPALAAAMLGNVIPIGE